MTGHVHGDARQDRSPASTGFEFRTKARNLAQLSGVVERSTVLPQEVVTASDWWTDPDRFLRRLGAVFAGTRVIVRSSAPGEDSAESSHAGEFHSVADVDVDRPELVAAAIDDVIASYERGTSAPVDSHEVLVQPMVPGVRMSGVVFTRDLDRNGPYYVVNYDVSDRTDTVTAGASSGHRVLRVFRGADLTPLGNDLAAVIEMARELEGVARSDALDIEFALGDATVPYLLQVRPLALTRIQSLRRLDRRVEREVGHVRSFVKEKLAATPRLHGAQGILGEMPDWNPAEIIGTHPKPLAHSLYRHLIMDRTWREARGLIGYRDPAPHQLLAVVGGRPYVDVRASFNSFVPRAVSEALAAKLVEHYLQRLRDHPELHDKVEFEIVLSCLAFDFDADAARLHDDGFTVEEVRELRDALRDLTAAVVTDAGGVLDGLAADVRRLAGDRDAALARHRSIGDIPMVVQQLLDDCIAGGTLPFSVFARCAFIGTSFLRSLVRRGVLSEDANRRYLSSIETVAGAFVDDLEACRRGAEDVATFLSTYGHLRPGTYDICSHTYAERPGDYLGVEPSEASTGGPDAAARARGPTDHAEPPDGLPHEVREATARLLEDEGFTFTVDELLDFVRRSIQLRESVKFEFTKNLSAALDLLAEFGRFHGLSREDMSFLSIEEVLVLADQSEAEDHLSHLRTIIERNRNRYEVTAAVNLPDLLFGVRDVDLVRVQVRRPNFVGSKRIVAEAHRLTAGANIDDDALRNRIVLIENADPGYDWLFGKGIAGLVTKYGGAASHMTIRCAEFGVPAAIGCGEQIFDQLEGARTVLLDCAGSQVAAYGS